MAGSSMFYFLPLLLLSSFPAITSSQKSGDGEKQTLLSIKTGWGNPPALDSWDNATTVYHCNWTGILCSAAGDVTEIKLVNVGINQPIPAAVCHLTNLSHLDLSNNDLPGPFPTVLYNCSSLAYLDISQNYLAGALPDDIDRLSPRLAYFSLAANAFNGDIPASISRLSSLQSLYLDNNLFDGSFPPELAALPSLSELTLAYNRFAQQRIPPVFGSFKSLTYLFIANASLVGEIPESLANITTLRWLDLSMNHLTGGIPPAIWGLTKLENLYLYANLLTGEIDVGSGIKALRLVGIDLSMNQLTGPIPDDFSKLKNLEVLFLYYNNLTGMIPVDIGLIPALTDIRLFNNRLTGSLPPELGKHSKLVNVEVDDNWLSGELPSHLCAGQVLKSVVVFDNNFTGEVPGTLGSCPLLDNLQLQSNRFTGEFPAGIWSAGNLTTVIIHHNALSGPLPHQLPFNLSRLEMESNRFSGSVPSSAPNLRVFRADDNLFSGDIPAAWGTGMPNLQTLSLGGNQISGVIPDGISSLRYLFNLNLRGNRLSGAIPASMGQLPVLTSLDLSSNQLSGEIPTELGRLNLNILNLSANHLSGEIPASLQSQAYDQSFLSNPSLCSTNPVLKLQACGSREARLGKQMLILFVVLGAALLLAAAGLAYLSARAYRRQNCGADLEASKLTSFHSLDFTESDIVRGLAEVNQIGSGGSGTVYRVVLGSRADEVVAVKKIWSSRKVDAKLEKEFEAEVNILGSIRHANIVKLLCCVSGAGSKLLVYEYMGNGSLDQWLHRRRRGPLDWPTRLGVAVGAARGLCYMHFDCSPPIVHRDVKSSNILLDSEFHARVADFGLARVLARAGEAESVSAIAGSFGYMAPECGHSRKLNEKVDVYSFGVVLLELVTGREANGEGDDGCLAEWAWQHYQDDGDLMDAVDEEIRDPTYLREIEVVFQLGLICTGSLPSSRPTMKEVMEALTRCDMRSGNGYRKPRGEKDVAPLLKGSRRVNPSADDLDYDSIV